MALLAKKAQIKLAEQGSELLKEKQTTLVKEFMKIAERAMTRSDELERVAVRADQSLARARALDGPEAVRSAGLAAQGEVSVEVSETAIMGVRVPVVSVGADVKRPIMERGYDLVGTSSRIDEVAVCFEDELSLIIEVADVEVRLKRLGEEIRKTTRRVNALENVLIPNLHAELRYIEMTLQEREREDIFRLKRMKRTIERRAAEAK
jgi:V/A-type H+-transporting ATPase subunit D